MKLSDFKSFYPVWIGSFHLLFNIQCVMTRSDEPSMMFFTSGTSGKPKMALHTHASYGLGHIITAK